MTTTAPTGVLSLARMSVPLDHYSMTAYECDCPLCLEFKHRRQVLDDAEAALSEQCFCAKCTGWGATKNRRSRMVLTADGVETERALGHSMVCKCELCACYRRARQAFLYISNQWHVVSETSYHASTDPELIPHRKTIMNRIVDYIQNPDFTPHWWASSASEIPLHFWLNRVTARLEASGFCASGSIAA